MVSGCALNKASRINIVTLRIGVDWCGPIQDLCGVSTVRVVRTSPIRSPTVVVLSLLEADRGENGEQPCRRELERVQVLRHKSERRIVLVVVPVHVEPQLTVVVMHPVPVPVQPAAITS
eukprot:gene5605-biopygen12199